MLFRVLEACLTIVAIVLTMKEVVLPLIQDKPLFPMIRKTVVETKKEQE